MTTEELINKEFEKRKFIPATKKVYSQKLTELFEFYSHIEPANINFDQIDSYLYRIKKSQSPSSMENCYWSFKLYFNEILGKNYPFHSLRLPLKDSHIPNVISQNQIKELLETFENLKHKTLITLLYATGMRVEELLELTPKDILSDKKEIRVRNTKTGKIRYPHLSDKLLKLLREYYVQYKPKKYLFEGQKKDTKYSVSSIRKILERAKIKAEIKEELTLISLRYCYIKHMVEQGQSLPALLKSMQVHNSDTVQFYYNLCGKSDKINYSPIDKLGVIIDTNKFNTIEIEKIFDSISNLDERDYLRESIACLKVGAMRAGVVFVWASAIRNLQNKCVEIGYKQINEALKKINQREKPIKQVSDFERLKDKTTLDIANKIGLITKHQKGELDKHLDLRNYCGHPSEYYPETQKIKAYLEDLINIILKK
ncbi:tyrosine-type recombinase/integrase [Hyunsoonleella sp. SJ7]|uniref:Tyrosine-type recombinase/integrase n=1 Tax=Hyunsoonleella aquatilis TaxID=2762758 RepID=A0A923HHT0_9FLAO|nr:tyrosine-type recombinase/integrase [Hyunsoonleella aquatilis]MBC3759555.1 tyrosine-type recombinase/integrase [Hyunsoonleella aquatilis]